ncbi:ClpP/crotonase [Cubamyces sp. BRFM 1775]|nr:ClpP/crotonase [Cubamyces sp. BRFM 1775]
MTYPISLPSSNPLVTLTHPTASLWVIELHNGADSRLTQTLIQRGLLPALDQVERHWRDNWRAGREKKDDNLCKGALIIVGNRKQDKFFSNGLDWDNIIKDPNFSTNFFPTVFNPLIQRLLSFPIPTVAAVNGHAFAGGMILAMACDYRVMTDGSKRNAWMCMNEIHFGATLPLSLASVLKAKAPNPMVLRKIILEGHRFTAKEALSVGLIDRIVAGDTESVVAEAQSLAGSVSSLPGKGAWGLNRREMYRDVYEGLSRDVLVINPIADDAAARARL